jgi:hypothetical protein
LLVLESLNPDAGPRRIVLLERTDTPAPVPRVWCEDIIEGETWTFVDVESDGDRLRIEFPSSKYEQMPSRYLLERPKHGALGSRWRLFAEDGTFLLAVLVLRRNEPKPGPEVLRIENFYRTGRPQLPPPRVKGGAPA